MDHERLTHKKPEGRLFQCSQCFKSYKRPEHLQRHSAVHKAIRDYACPRCGATFHRSDVLNRHTKTCDGKQSRRTSLVKRACDECIKSKRRCSSNPPCSVCRRKDVPCTFTASTADRCTSTELDSQELIDLPLTTVPSASTDTTAESMVWPEDEMWGQFLDIDLPDFTIDDLDLTMMTGNQGNDGQTLRFLESFTRNTGFVNSFDCLTVEERALAYTTFNSRLDASTGAGDDLLLKSHEIVTLIREAVQVKPRNNAVELTWSPVLQAMCMDFFSPRRTRLWLELYWSIWHPNVNYMHRLTFQPGKTKAALVASMCIIGALVSPHESDNESARLWMNCVEEMVFRDDDVCNEGARSNSFPTTGRLQALQAMYMVCLFQNWEGDEASKGRIRRFRYSTLVAVARDIGIHNARHAPYHSLQPSTFYWRGFVAREQLIRVLMWVFLLDTAFVIFNNVPPRMAIKEMKMHLACNEAAFQASSSDSCFSYLQDNAVDAQHTLSSMTAILCKAPIPPDTQALLADVGPLNMFALTSALHSVIFQTQQTFGFDTQLTPVRVALDNWKAIWQIYSTVHALTFTHRPLQSLELHPDNMWQRVGFMRFASEYCLLAELVVDRIAQSAKQIGTTSTAASTDDVFDNDDAAPTVLNKYDETSMRQVNDLISEFQKVVL